MNTLPILAAVIGAALTLGATGLLAWLIRRRRRPASAATGSDATARMARDIGVMAELLAAELAKLWEAGDAPASTAADPDTVYHHVRESTEQIMRSAGASPKAAMAVAALTAKRVRPGPIKGPQVGARTPQG